MPTTASVSAKVMVAPALTLTDVGAHTSDPIHTSPVAAKVMDCSGSSTVTEVVVYQQAPPSNDAVGDYETSFMALSTEDVVERSTAFMCPSNSRCVVRGGFVTNTSEVARSVSLWIAGTCLLNNFSLAAHETVELEGFSVVYGTQLIEYACDGAGVDFNLSGIESVKTAA